MVDDSSKSVLAALLQELPSGIWWKVRQMDPNEFGLAKGTGRPLAEIDALLVGAGPCNDTPKRGIHWSKKGWDTFVDNAKLPTLSGAAWRPLGRCRASLDAIAHHFVAFLSHRPLAATTVVVSNSLLLRAFWLRFFDVTARRAR